MIKLYQFADTKSSCGRVRFRQKTCCLIFLLKTNIDLYFMQGYVTAQNRLWQMEIQTHNAAGRISEIIGEKGLDNDRLQRRIGLEFGAKNAQDYIALGP
jgi:penicillin amidase